MAKVVASKEVGRPKNLILSRRLHNAQRFSFQGHVSMRKRFTKSLSFGVRLISRDMSRHSDPLHLSSLHSIVSSYFDFSLRSSSSFRAHSPPTREIFQFNCISRGFLLSTLMLIWNESLRHVIFSWIRVHYWHKTSFRFEWAGLWGQCHRLRSREAWWNETRHSRLPSGHG